MIFQQIRIHKLETEPTPCKHSVHPVYKSFPKYIYFCLSPLPSFLPPLDPTQITDEVSELHFLSIYVPLQSGLQTMARVLKGANLNLLFLS